MPERYHDTHIPSRALQLLKEAGLTAHLSESSAMAARCVICLTRSGHDADAETVARCLKIERTTAVHRLGNLAEAGLVERAGERNPRNGRIHAYYVPVEVGRDAFEVMPSLSGCMLAADPAIEVNSSIQPSTPAE